MSEKTRRSERNRRQFEPAQEEEKMVPETRNGEITGASLVNIRSKPDASEKTNIVTVLKNGERVEIVDEIPNWYKIKYKSDFCWVSAKFCKILEE